MSTKVTFSCERYPTLEIVVSPLHITEGKNGRQIKHPAKKINFQRVSGTIGEVSTSDEESIEKVKESHFFKTGLIFTDKAKADKAKAAKPADSLRQGTTGSPKAELLPPAPEEKSKKVGAAKAPKRGKAAA